MVRSTHMALDPEVCSRARLARDPRFDGKFFIGVFTTKVYCRPICRARTCKEENVRYFPTAAAAAEAGFRPCLRCRPECAPGSPVWAGTRNTVSRALQLITECGLEGGGVETLAERVGVGSRHLRRLFLRHLGATPAAVAHSMRLHFAKKLIDETRLSMGQIAFAAGFGSVRRFNAAIRSVYHRTPTHIRRLAPRVAAQAENDYLFRLTFREPFRWKRILEFLAARATPGVEAVLDGCYRRSLSLRGVDGYFEVALEEKNTALSVRIQFGEPRSLFFIVERVRAMFDLSADWDVIAEALRVDPALAAWLGPEAGLRVPGCWSGFELAVRAILEQQAKPKAASGLAGRVVEALGRPFSPTKGITRLFPTAEALANARLIGLGVPSAKADTIGALSRALCDGRLKFEGIADGDAFLSTLMDFPGFTNWAAQYVAMRALRDPDAFPSDDPILRLRAGNSTALELEHRSQVWRPWRAYAAMLLWQAGGVEEDSVPARIPTDRPGPVREELRALRRARASAHD
jgi:AraC family transcriptional regulator, regulatory protein of adaptative response / DNA-3-methyladenine glycosylase II